MRRRRSDIGRELLTARDAGVRWKELSKRYGLSRSRLYQLWTKAAGRGAGGIPHACACPNCGVALTVRAAIETPR